MTRNDEPKRDLAVESFVVLTSGKRAYVNSSVETIPHNLVMVTQAADNIMNSLVIYSKSTIYSRQGWIKGVGGSKGSGPAHHLGTPKYSKEGKLTLHVCAQMSHIPIPYHYLYP